MRKNKAKATAKVDAFLAEPFANDEARMERIIEQAKAESFRRAAEQPENAKKKGLWRGAPALCALVIILIVAPIIAVIVNPVNFSKANQLVRKATIWVNDTFKLELELAVEKDSPLERGERSIVFDSMKDAASYLGKDFPALEENDMNKLISIEITDCLGITIITQIYEYKEEKVWLTAETILDHYADAVAENAIQIVSSIGNLWMWSTDDTYRAIGIAGEWSVDLRTATEVKEVVDLFETLKWFN